MVLALFIVARFSAYEIFRGYFQSIPNAVLCQHLRLQKCYFFSDKQKVDNNGGIMEEGMGSRVKTGGWKIFEVQAQLFLIG